MAEVAPAQTPAGTPATIDVHFQFRVTDPALLERAYRAYVRQGSAWVNADCETHEQMAEELIIGLMHRYSTWRAGDVLGWEDFGLER